MNLENRNPYSTYHILTLYLHCSHAEMMHMALHPLTSTLYKLLQSAVWSPRYYDNFIQKYKQRAENKGWRPPLLGELHICTGLYLAVLTQRYLP